MPVTYATLTNSGSEWGEQAAVFLWRSRHVGSLPILRWMHAINNQGHGDAVRGARDKAVGVTAGVYDLFLPVPVHGRHTMYHGLYIEMKKTKGGRASPEQKEFGAYAEQMGYAHKVCHGHVEAIDTILSYLEYAGYVQDPAQFAPID